LLKHPEIAPYISPNDSIGVIFGKEHPSWVLELSHEAYATLAFKHSLPRLNGINFASCSATSIIMEDKFVKMENELDRF